MWTDDNRFAKIAQDGKPNVPRLPGRRLLRFFVSHLWFLESFRRRQPVSRLISSMSHKAEGLSRNRCRKKDCCRLRLSTNDKGSVSSVSCEKSEATVAHLLPKSEYPNIVTVNLFDD